VVPKSDVILDLRDARLPSQFTFPTRSCRAVAPNHFPNARLPNRAQRAGMLE
jgi:hypothetical protein